MSQNQENQTYTFDELSSEAKDRVRYSGIVGDHWNREAWDSLEKWRGLLDFHYNTIDVENRIVRNLRASATNWDAPYGFDHELSGDRLRVWIINNLGWFLYEGKYFSLTSKVHDSYTTKSRRSNILKEMAMPTGYCMDLEFILPMHEFLKSWGTRQYTTYVDVIEECIHAWMKAFQDDIDWQYENEYISEHCAANGYKFYENGEMA